MRFIHLPASFGGGMPAPIRPGPPPLAAGPSPTARPLTPGRPVTPTHAPPPRGHQPGTGLRDVTPSLIGVARHYPAVAGAPRSAAPSTGCGCATETPAGASTPARTGFRLPRTGLAVHPDMAAELMGKQQGAKRWPPPSAPGPYPGQGPPRALDLAGFLTDPASRRELVDRLVGGPPHSSFRTRDCYFSVVPPGCDIPSSHPPRARCDLTHCYRVQYGTRPDSTPAFFRTCWVIGQPWRRFLEDLIDRCDCMHRVDRTVDSFKFCQGLRVLHGLADSCYDPVPACIDANGLATVVVRQSDINRWEFAGLFELFMRCPGDDRCVR